ncbi:MAG: hypothetical protein ACK41Y_09115 [Paracoccus hibiscisoli]|uniref:hypothetical protein n=1 Tax=Paracoccus hibiscisoli TaxID=2023261 RepID=UPI00391B6B8E
MIHQLPHQAFRPALSVRPLPVISVLGLGRQGVMTAAVLADLGHHVIGVDVDPDRVETLAQGRIAHIEPALAALVRRGVLAGRIQASDDILPAVLASDVTIVTGGCNIAEPGQSSCHALQATGRTLGQILALKDGFHVVMQQAPVLPGTIRGVLQQAIQQVSGLTAGRDFGICHWPARPSNSPAGGEIRIPSGNVLGVGDRRTAVRIGAILAQLGVQPTVTSIEVAEMAGHVGFDAPEAPGRDAPPHRGAPMLDALAGLCGVPA